MGFLQHFGTIRGPPEVSEPGPEKQIRAVTPFLLATSQV